MDRRNFLKTSAFAGLALTAAPQLLDAKGEKVLRPDWNSELWYHKIQSIEYAETFMKYPRLVGKNAKKDLHGYGPRLRMAIIKTDQGAEGFAQVRGKHEEIVQMGQKLIGKRITDVFDPAIGITTDDAFHFDLALHDLAGNILGVPCHEIFGEKKPLKTKIYSGMIYFDDLDPQNGLTPMEQIAANAAFDYSKGYRQFKLKIGRGAKWMEKKAGIQRDVEITQFFAEKYPDCEILVDANDGYTCDEFIQYLETIKGIDLFWIEEPFLETEADWKKLREYTHNNGRAKTLLADGEFRPDFDFILELGRKKILDVNLLDIHDYGFTRWRKYMPIMKSFGMQASPHAWGSLNKTIYAGHMAAGYGNTCTIEGVTCTCDELDFGDWKIEKGLFVPPTGTGWGMKLLTDKRIK